MKSLTTYKFIQDNNIFFSLFGLICFLTFICVDNMDGQTNSALHVLFLA